MLLTVREKEAHMAEKKAAHGNVTEKVNPATNEKESVNPDVKKNLTAGKVKVRITRLVRSSYGAFDKGEVVELDAATAAVFLKDGRAESV